MLPKTVKEKNIIDTPSRPGDSGIKSVYPNPQAKAVAIDRYILVSKERYEIHFFKN